MWERNDNGGIHNDDNKDGNDDDGYDDYHKTKKLEHTPELTTPPENGTGLFRGIAFVL